MTPSAHAWRDRPGVIVLAAYRPDPQLFRIQLESIRDQTCTNWRCLIGADGGQDEIRRLVVEFVGEDPRFEVVGWDDNLGFYLNFERLLDAVPTDADWVALSDQDDRWYPDKLERLLPLLSTSLLATGQARVVQHPSGRVLLAKTQRKVVPAGDLLIENQVSGALAVFRRELLELALPFPRHPAVTQLHDHWIGLCAATSGRYLVLDFSTQDYVQHGGNTIGEVGATRPPWTPRLIWHRLLSLGEQYEGGRSPGRVLRASHALSYGWRRAMIREISERLGTVPPPLVNAWAALGEDAPLWRRLAYPLIGTTPGNVELSVKATFIAGMPGELVPSWRRPRTVRGRGA